MKEACEEERRVKMTRRKHLDASLKHNSAQRLRLYYLTDDIIQTISE